MGYLIKYQPFTYEENGKDEIYKSLHGEQQYEYYDDEIKFLIRCRDLEANSDDTITKNFYDGVVMETFYCDLREYRR